MILDEALDRLDHWRVWLDFKTGSGKRYRWSPEEDAVLRQWFGRESRAVCAGRVTAVLRERTGDETAGRTRDAVAIRARQIGVPVYQGEVDEMSLRQASRWGEVSYNLLHQAARVGELPSVRRGKGRYVREMDLSHWLVAHREKLLARAAVLESLEEGAVISKQEGMLLANLSETHFTRYLITGVIRGWKIPDLTSGARGEWVVERESVLAYIQARDGGRLATLLNKNSFYVALRRQSTMEIRTLRQAGRVSTTRRPAKLGFDRQRRKIAKAGLLTVRDLAGRWGIREETVTGYVRDGKAGRRLVGQRRGHLLVFEPGEVEAFEGEVLIQVET